MLLESDRNRIQHMLDAANQALKFVQNTSLSELPNDVPLQHLLVRNLEIIGEAASRITPEFRNAHPEIPWHRLIGMRNRLIHAYFDINMVVVWTTVVQFLPELLDALKSIVTESEG